MRREVSHRRCDLAEIDHIDAAALDAARKGGGKFRSGMAAIAADHDVALLARTRFRTQCVADLFNDFRGEASADNAAYVVGLEDFGG
jgi:hypothetical protein